ncbi:MAG: hypothetical protein WB778_07420 [Thermoplasmata archaeon]
MESKELFRNGPDTSRRWRIIVSLLIVVVLILVSIVVLYSVPIRNETQTFIEWFGGKSSAPNFQVILPNELWEGFCENPPQTTLGPVVVTLFWSAQSEAKTTVYLQGLGSPAPPHQQLLPPILMYEANGTLGVFAFSLSQSYYGYPVCEWAPYYFSTNSTVSLSGNFAYNHTATVPIL